MKFTINPNPIDWHALPRTPLRCEHSRLSSQVCMRCGVVVPWLNGDLTVWQRALDRVLRWMKGFRNE